MPSPAIIGVRITKSKPFDNYIDRVLVNAFSVHHQPVSNGDSYEQHLIRNLKIEFISSPTIENSDVHGWNLEYLFAVNKPSDRGHFLVDNQDAVSKRAGILGEES